MARLMLPDVLTVNAGSTSVKLSRRVDGRDVAPPADLDAALTDPRKPAVVVHRVVHGGDRTRPEVLSDATVADLRSLVDLAPLHQPAALDAIDRCRSAWPGAVQVACFDTTFHTTLPPGARTYALPLRLRERVRVYGFHGLSHAWSTARARAFAPSAKRILVAHLGGGQSLCGTVDGKSQVTTMGFTPLDGLVMATRSGSIDPGALLYLVRHPEVSGVSDPTALDGLLERRSGLFGFVGTGDMREVLRRRAAGDADAALGFDVWLHRLIREAGGCIAAIGGLDAVVFTGGVGENSAPVREAVADGLAMFGVRLGVNDIDPPDDQHDVVDIGSPGAAVRTFVVHAREDRQMISEAEALLA